MSDDHQEPSSFHAKVQWLFDHLPNHYTSQQVSLEKCAVDARLDEANVDDVPFKFDNILYVPFFSAGKTGRAAYDGVKWVKVEFGLETILEPAAIQAYAAIVEQQLDEVWQTREFQMFYARRTYQPFWTHFAELWNYRHFGTFVKFPFEITEVEFPVNSEGWQGMDVRTDALGKTYRFVRKTGEVIAQGLHCFVKTPDGFYREVRTVSPEDMRDSSRLLANACRELRAVLGHL